MPEISLTDAYAELRQAYLNECAHYESPLAMIETNGSPYAGNLHSESDAAALCGNETEFVLKPDGAILVTARNLSFRMREEVADRILKSLTTDTRFVLGMDIKD